MKNTVKINSAELVHADSLEYIKTLPDNSLDAIITMAFRGKPLPFR